MKRTLGTDQRSDFEIVSLSPSNDEKSSRQQMKSNRQIEIDEQTGKRSFRDDSGRRRFICSNLSCTNMLKRQNDLFCQKHTTDHDNQSDEYELPSKIDDQSNSIRSFRDTSGKIRFLCSNPTCNSRLIRRSDIFCKKHHNDSSELPLKKRPREPETILNNSHQLSLIPENQMVLATTTLLENQWNDVLKFLRQYSQVQLSPNCNINDSTTHLLIDDYDNPLHCIITKKIVQAAVRRHVFIISVRWISDCLVRGEFLSEYPYEIQSDCHTSLRLSKSNSDEQYLFNQSYAFAIECRQCLGSINRNELIELILLSGAKFYEDETINFNATEILIVLCDMNEKHLDEIKEKYSNQSIRMIKYVTCDFLLKSIIKFHIQDIDKYVL